MLLEDGSLPLLPLPLLLTRDQVVEAPSNHAIEGTERLLVNTNRNSFHIRILSAVSGRADGQTWRQTPRSFPRSLARRWELSAHIHHMWTNRGYVEAYATTSTMPSDTGLERIAPPQPRKTGEVGVVGVKLALVLDGDGRQMGVGRGRLRAEDPAEPRAPRGAS